MSYPTRKMSRRFPCIACHKPDAAVREGTRCTKCSRANSATCSERRRIEKRDEARARAEQMRAAAEAAPVDLNVQAYRAEKERRAAHLASDYDTLLAQAALQFARELEVAKPKRGRPRTDYGRRSRPTASAAA